MDTPTNDQIMDKLATELGISGAAVREMSQAELRPAMELVIARHRRAVRDNAREALIASRLAKLMELGGCPDDMTMEQAIATGRVSQQEVDRALNPTEEQVTRAMERPEPAEGETS